VAGLSAPGTPDTVDTEKRQLLCQMDADLIREIKVLSIDWKVTASTLVGVAVVQLLSRCQDNDHGGM
jgi:hypothetical protein